MKFSIVFLLMVTLWIALGIQICRAFDQTAACVQQRKVTEQETSGLRREMTYWKDTKVDQTVVQLQEDLNQFDKIDQELVRAFEPEVPALSVVTPQKDKVSIRTIPLLKRSWDHGRKVKIHVPASRGVSIKAELQPIDGEEEAEIASVSDVDFDPGNPAITKLSPGMHTIEWKSSYDKTSASFVTLVDSKVVHRFSWKDTTLNGFSSTSPNWYQQKDITSKRSLPQLGKFSPGQQQTEVVLQLIDSE